MGDHKNLCKLLNQLKLIRKMKAQLSDPGFAKHSLVNNLSKVKEDCLIIPFGKSVEETITILIQPLGIKNPILKGFPHPSPGSVSRSKIFNENINDLRKQIEEFF